MGLMNQPTTFFTGGFRIKGDVQLTGDIVQDPIKIGEGAETLENTIGIGRNATATGGGSTSVGIESDALAQHATAYGKNAQALAQDTTAIGNETTAPANWNTVVGYDAGSFQNGENIVLIGRKSEGQGDDSVAIGENARANGLQSSAIGKATSALAKNSSAFGQGATVTGDEATVVGQGVTLTSDRATSVGTGVSATAEGATGVGRGAVASAKNATAVGNGAEANGVNSAAIGNGVIVNEDNSFSFGNRNISLPIGRSFLYPANPGIQSVINFSVTSDAAAGTEHSYTFDAGGVSVFKIFSESDGSGGTKNHEFRAIQQLNLNGNTILDSNSDTTIYDSSNQHIPSSALQFTDVTINGSNGLSAGTAPLGGSTTVSISGNLSLDSNLQAVGGEIIWNESQGHIPQSRLENASITLNGGTGLKSGSTASLGGSFSLEVEPNGFAGSGLEDDGSDNLQLVNDSITLSGGNGLKNGSTVKLGNSVSLDVEPADFAGQFIQDSGSDALEVLISNGLENDGNGNIRVSGSSLADSFISVGTNPHQLSVNIGDGIEGDGNNNIRVRGDSVSDAFLSEGSFPHKISVNLGQGVEGDGANNIRVNAGAIAGNALTENPTTPHLIDVASDSIGSGELVNDSITVSTGNGLSGGSTISLGNSSTLSVDTSSFISSGTQGVSVNIGNGLTGDGSNNIKVNTSELSFDASQTLFDAGIDVRGDIVNNTNVIYNSTQNHIPTSILQNDSITISTGANISGGGSPTLGGSGISLGLVNTDITISGQNGIDGETASLGETIDVGILGSFELDTDLKSNSTGTNVIIWDESKGYIPQNRLENDSITINTSNGLSAGSATLGQSVSIGISGNLSLDSDLQAVDGETIWSETNTHVPESALETLSNSALTNSSISIDGSSVSLGGSITVNLSDGQQRLFGTNNDIGLRFDSTADSFKIQDNINTNDIVDIDRSSGDVSISGELTEGAAL